ncbi:MAG: C40 family peptidase [Gammaproteobacteria bacterium]|nr:C40 family peptidase [Gammaproteobacteria bacterium]
MLKTIKTWQILTGSCLILLGIVSGCSSSPHKESTQHFPDAKRTGLPKTNGIKNNLDIHRRYQSQREQSQQEQNQQLFHLFERWQGTPYQLGGLSRQGIDCSGWIFLVYQSVFQHTIPRTTYQQSKLGTNINQTQLEFGDLVFFNTGPKVRHVGIFIGDDQFMHASTRRGVIISNLNNSYWRPRFWQARRILN